MHVIKSFFQIVQVAYCHISFLSPNAKIPCYILLQAYHLPNHAKYNSYSFLWNMFFQVRQAAFQSLGPFISTFANPSSSGQFFREEECKNTESQNFIEEHRYG